MAVIRMLKLLLIVFFCTSGISIAMQQPSQQALNEQLFYLIRFNYSFDEHCKHIEELIKKGADLNYIHCEKNGEKSSPLYEAMKWKNKKFALYLLNKGANPNLLVNYENILIRAVRSSLSDKHEMIKRLVRYGADISKRDFMGANAFDHALSNGDYNTVKIFLIHGAIPRDNILTDKNISDLISSHRALFAATKTADTKLLKEIAQQITINSKDAKGNTPLHLATLNRNYNLIRYLLSLGADPEKINKENQTPLYIAVLHGPHDLLPIYLQAAHSHSF